MQIEGTKLIFSMNFSVLDFFKFASICTDFSLDFQKFFPRGACPRTPLGISSFFSLATPGSEGSGV